jgi:CheY-like chemotaxis protein
MDLQMPEMDGYQATTKLRGDTRFASLPIIAMTAHATMEERQRCLAAGMNDHISKPIDPGNLYDTIGRFYKPVEIRGQIPLAPGIAASQAVENRSSGKDELPCINGLDTKDGLSRVGGNRKLYLKLLGQFVEQQGSAVTQVTSALSQGEEALAERIAHTLKGVAGNIGAKLVQGAASALEKALREKAGDTQINLVKEEVAATLGPFITKLKAALNSTVSNGPPTRMTQPTVSSAESLEAAKQLERLISEFDPLAAEFLETNQAALFPLFENGAWNKFEKLLQGYAFTEAQSELGLALKKLSS